jgi:hypothetical protein
VARGFVLHDGSGRKSSPFRYWLPEKEAQWLQDPLYVFEAEQLARPAKAQEGSRGLLVPPEQAGLSDDRRKFERVLLYPIYVEG